MKYRGFLREVVLYGNKWQSEKSQISHNKVIKIVTKEAAGVLKNMPDNTGGKKHD